MKKKIIILKILLIPALLVGCSGQTGFRITANESTVIQTLDSQVATDSILQEVTSKTDLEDAAPYDELFLANFSEAIQTRWKLTNDTEDESGLTFEEEVRKEHFRKNDSLLFY